MPPGLVAIHLDEVNTNNMRTNLKWGPQSENMHRHHANAGLKSPQSLVTVPIPRWLRDTIRRQSGLRGTAFEREIATALRSHYGIKLPPGS
jgi:hypothetical protein